MLVYPECACGTMPSEVERDFGRGVELLGELMKRIKDLAACEVS